MADKSIKPSWLEVQEGSTTSPAYKSPSTATASDADTTQTFNILPNFPLELQFSIFEMCLPQRVHLYQEEGVGNDELYNHHGKHCKKELQLGVQAAQLPVVSRVSVEARNVVLANGTMKKTMVFEHNQEERVTSNVWVDKKRDTILINLGYPVRDYEFPEPYNVGNPDTISDVHVRSMIRKKEVRVAVLDEAISQDGPDCYISFPIYKELIHGHEECDLGLIEIQFNITDEEAVDTDLFGLFGTEAIALVPVDNPLQMSRLYSAQIKFNPKILWTYFSHDARPRTLPLFLMPGSSAEYAEEWMRCGALRAEVVQHHIARLLAFDEAGHDFNLENPDEIWPNGAGEPQDRIAALKDMGTKFRPVLVVHRCDRRLLT